MTYKLILTTCPDLTSAHTIAEGLVKLDIAACVNILPTVVSIYKWQGEVEQSAECQLFIKTNEINWSKVESYLQDNHPYDVPEIIQIDISNGSTEYFSWMQNNLQQGE
jgi:periplasmic divalent cation tolerance protein